MRIAYITTLGLKASLPCKALRSAAEMRGIEKVTILESPRTVLVETFQAQEPFEISIFGAKNKTWRSFRHQAVEPRLKVDSDSRKVEFLKISVWQTIRLFAGCLDIPKMGTWRMPHISAADKDAEEAWEGASRPWEEWPQGDEVSGGDVWHCWIDNIGEPEDRGWRPFKLRKPSISIFGAKNKTWGIYRHPVVESCLKNGFW
jgi:hypothetical protein